MKERKQSYFKKISSSLPKIIDKKVKEKNFIEISLIKNWKKIIGNNIAEFCWPIKVSFQNINNSNGIIFLKTSRGKSMEIEFKNEEFIEKLNQYFGYKAISKISIVQDFKVENNYKKKEFVKKNKKKIDLKEVNKLKKNSLKNALKRLNKTLFD